MAKQRPLEIDLSNQSLTDEQLIEHVRSGVFGEDAGVLRLGGNQLTAESLSALADSQMAYVHTLSARGNRLGDEGARVLAERVMFCGVKSLDLSDNQVTALGAELLYGAASLFSGAFWLLLDDNPIGDEGVRAIATSLRARYLQTLALDRTGVTDAGAVVIASSPVLSELQHLTLSANPITEIGRRALQDSPHLRLCAITLD